MKNWQEVAQEVSTLTDPTGHPVDKEIEQLVIGLRCFGIPSYSSCAGHLGEENAPFIEVLMKK
jgi:hypothetical protein